MSFFANVIEKPPKIGFYAPDFLIEVEGRPLDQQTRGDVLSIKIILELEKIATATVKLNNWEDRETGYGFKYSDLQKFSVDSRVRLQVGYVGNLVPLLAGQINSISPDFPEKGASTITLGIQDRLQLLKDRKPADAGERQFRNLTDLQIAQQIADRNKLDTDFDDDPKAVTHDEVVQGDEDDASFLLKLAHRNDFDCFVYVDDEGKDKLRFGPPRRAVDHNLKWRRTLRSFAPTITMSKQVSKVTVRGWNIDRKEAVIGEAVAGGSEKKGSGSSGGEKAKTAAGDRQEVVIGAAVQTKEEADKLALSLLQDRANAFITGKGSIIGRADMRPGDTVSIEDLGEMFSGSYDVTKVEHVLDDKGFSTSFDVRKTYVAEKAE